VWTVNVVFDEATALDLERMTANNVSGRVAIALGDELLAVSRIVAPIAGGSLSFQCQAHRLQKVLGNREDKGTGF
jgi:preprotein translocase subunit SecD